MSSSVSVPSLTPLHRLARAYLLLVGLPLLALLGLLAMADRFHSPVATFAATTAASGVVAASASKLAPQLLAMQIVTILIAARLIGSISRRFGQPRVVGEMVAGIVLGPSVFGALAKGAYTALFSVGSLEHLNLISQVGLTIFMFQVGMSLDSDKLHRCGHAAVLTSHASIAFPFALGALLARYIYPSLSGDGVSFVVFALFMGAAMSITAFPVLARILAERDLIRSSTGTLAIACAAVDDVSGWCILTYISTLVRGADSAMPLWETLAGSLTFVAGMLFVIRPLLARYGRVFLQDDGAQYQAMALVLLLTLSSACVSELLGIHLLFGGFLAGVVMPKNLGIGKLIRDQIEPVTQALFLPLFFAFTGLRTSVALLRGAEMWSILVLLIAVAVIGKMGGSTLAAHWAGIPWRDAGAIGALLNTRGLMELVILNIGLDLHIIQGALFTMMVLMAVVTTFMTSPLLAWLRPRSLISVDLQYSREEQVV